MPWMKRRRGDEICVFKRGQDGEPTGDSLGCHASEDDANAQIAALEANVTEYDTGAAGDHIAIREYTIGQFRGNFPDVPIADGVNMDELRAMDTEPLFVTLPVIPKVGVVSKNGLLYDDELALEIETQIINKRPGGIFGHLKDSDRDSAFPVPEGLWVGALREGETLWGKAYIPPGKARDHIRRLKATGGQIATSIYGRGQYTPVRKGVNRLSGFQLESLDFAPPDRAALGYAATPHLTAEMDEVAQENDNMTLTKAEVIAELTVTDLPDGLRKAVVEAYKADTAHGDRVTELEQQVSDRDSTIDTLNGVIAEFRHAEFDRKLDAKIAELLDWKVTTDEGKTKFESFRRTLKSRIVSELGDTTDQAKVDSIVAETWEDLKPLAETVRDALAGPPAIVGGKVPKPKLQDTPETRREARGAFGI